MLEPEDLPAMDFSIADSIVRSIADSNCLAALAIFALSVKPTLAAAGGGTCGVMAEMGEVIG